MLIRNQLLLAADPDLLFAKLLDMDYVASAIPGASLTPAEHPGAPRRGEVDVDAGLMRFRYAGTIALVEADHGARRARFVGSGKEASGQGNAEVQLGLTVSPGDAGSLLAVETELAITGPAARLGHGFIEDFAQQMMEDFGQVVLRRMGGLPAGGTAADVSVGPNRFNAVGFAMRLIARRIRKLFGARAAQRGARHAHPASVAASTAGPVRYDREVDVLIAGTGSGALTAAITAREAGLDVLIVEKAKVIGGGSAYSGGVIWAPCNHIMARKHIADDVEQALRYLDGASAGRGDPALQRRYVETVGPLVAQIEAWTDIPWIIWPGQPDYYPDLPGASLNGRAILQHPATAHRVLTALEKEMPGFADVRLTPHMDFVPGFQTADRPAREAWVAGRAVIGGLWLAVLRRNIPYLTETPLEDLIVEDGRVTGGVVRHADGRSERIRARRGLLLNTGGMDWNDTLTRRYLPGPTTRPQTPPSNSGDGHVMAMRLGAAVALMDKAVLHPSICIPGDRNDGEQLYRMFNEDLAKPHGILVNRTGRRFSSESAYFGVSDAWNAVDQRTRDFPNVPSYLVVDAQFRRKYGLPSIREGDPLPDWIATADTIPELAEKIGVDPVGLAAEIEIYNRDCGAGIDSRFGRGTSAYERYWGDPDQKPNPTMGEIAVAPYFAFQVHPSHAGTRGGVVITVDGEVLRADGTVIEGLFACGNTAANLLFGAGYGSGSAVGSSVVFGHLAARKMAGAAAVSVDQAA